MHGIGDRVTAEQASLPLHLQPPTSLRPTTVLERLWRCMRSKLSTVRAMYACACTHVYTVTAPFVNRPSEPVRSPSSDVEHQWQWSLRELTTCVREVDLHEIWWKRNRARPVLHTGVLHAGTASLQHPNNAMLKLFLGSSSQKITHPPHPFAH
jgi:hypothetical protein